MTTTEPATARDGERQRRFMALLDPVHASLNRFARMMSRDREEARDLINETLLVAYERFDSLGDERAFLSFLFTIAHRSCMRSQRRRRLFGALSLGAASRLTAGTTPPDVSADVAALHAAFAKLPAVQREAVALYELSGLSLEEIRTIQGGTLSGVKARVARGRRRLAALLGVSEATPGARPRNVPPPRTPDASDEALFSFTAGGTHD
jgi:RNA polymerase sigma-70 factor, ECF subfamily